jgi:hypothetical protein
MVASLGGGIAPGIEGRIGWYVARNARALRLNNRKHNFISLATFKAN